MENRRAVVIAGGEINSYERIRSFFMPGDYYIFCDSGLVHKEKLLVEPDLIIGDFDSHERVETESETIILPEKKDDTDSISGIKTALDRGFRDFLLIGMTGRRMDHSLCNLYSLSFIKSHNGRGVIVDDWSEMEVVEKEKAYVSDTYAYFSLVAWKGKCEGVNIENALYPLSSAVIEPEYQYGISNEPLKGGSRVWVEKGSLLLIKDWRKEK